MANVDQDFARVDNRNEHHTVRISAPHEWDGIGQALHCAYGSHRQQPGELADILEKLERVD